MRTLQPDHIEAPPFEIPPPPGGNRHLRPESIGHNRRRRRQRKLLQGAEADLQCDTMVQICGAPPPPWGGGGTVRRKGGDFHRGGGVSTGQNTSVDLSELQARAWTAGGESRGEQAQPEPKGDIATRPLRPRTSGASDRQAGNKQRGFEPTCRQFCPNAAAPALEGVLLHGAHAAAFRACGGTQCLMRCTDRLRFQPLPPPPPPTRFTDGSPTSDQLCWWDMGCRAQLPQICNT